MKLKEHTRNQKRMYRIHKQEDRIHDLELMIGELQQKNKQLKEVIDKAIKYCDNNKEFTPRLEDVLDILKEVSE